MSEDQFERRGNALEDMFFYRSDQELLEQIKQDLADKEAREQLASFSGITNEHLLDELVSQNVRAETLACVTLIPLVVVAWADGKLDDDEIYYSFGYQANGVNTAPWSGNELSKLIISNSKVLNISKFYQGLPKKFPFPKLRLFYLRLYLMYCSIIDR